MGWTHFLGISLGSHVIAQYLHVAQTFDVNIEHTRAAANTTFSR